MPDALLPDEQAFESMWRLHPEAFHELVVHGRPVKTPRWQQAFGRDYHYTGRVNRALPVPAVLAPLQRWCVETIDPRLDALLLNWYDGDQKHYIGRHRDSSVGMCPDSPIVTISLGGTRTFRLRPWKGKGTVDFTAPHGRVFVMPYATNQAWTHEVPHFARDHGRRISVTLRAFEPDV